MVLIRHIIIMLNVLPFLLLHVLTISSLVDLTVATEIYIPNTKEKSRDTTSSVAEKITDAVLEEVFGECESILKNREELIEKLFKAGKIIKESDRKHDLSLNRARKTDPQIHAIEEKQLVFDCSSDLLIKKFQLSRDDSKSVLPTIPLRNGRSKAIVDACTTAIAADNVYCDPESRYRTINGQCNNFLNPRRWGSANSCQNRLLPAYYEGQSEFRKSLNGEPLPSPRILSTNLFFNYNSPTDNVTHMFVFFGQLLDHDIAFTPPTTTLNNKSIECCPPENENHPQCAPIILPSDDYFYSQFGHTCMNIVRSAICPTCALGPRQVINQVTAFIDASFLYGNSVSEMRSLRENDGTGNNQKSGRLRSQRTNGEELLPRSSNPQNDQCSFPATNDICFEAGDLRANQHTVLTSLHTLFLREHNRIASELRMINPQWNDERLFQETRRILGAIVQVITYKEYLPVVLGDNRMSYFNLSFGSNTMYDPQIDPTMMIEFTTAAFRFGHSMINSVVTNYLQNDTRGHRLLRDEFFQPFDLYKGLTGPLLAGASNSPAQGFGRNLVPDVTDYLYRTRGDQFGLDLAAININRGRDHGIPTYVEMVSYCSVNKIIVRSFGDLVVFKLMNEENMNALRQNYRYVQDVDLFAGILLETPSSDAVVGPTAACVIGKQFQHLKFGDRFYVEHWNHAGRFTYQQLQELEQITLSEVICLNTEVSRLATNAMVYSSRKNPIISCKHVRGINLSYWSE